VDYRKNQACPTVSVAYELTVEHLHTGDAVAMLDTEGGTLGETTVTGIRNPQPGDHTVIVQLAAPAALAKRVAGIRMPATRWTTPLPEAVQHLSDDAIVCRCERVTAGEIRARIREGCRDLNELKAVTRAGMGACGGKTCTALILRLFREEGIPVTEVTEGTYRPLFVETPLGVLAGARETADD
jgi:bacterioferritin-associated ferredoxin